MWVLLVEIVSGPARAETIAETTQSTFSCLNSEQLFAKKVLIKSFS